MYSERILNFISGFMLKSVTESFSQLHINFSIIYTKKYINKTRKLK